MEHEYDDSEVEYEEELNGRRMKDLKKFITELQGVARMKNTATSRSRYGWRW